MMNMTQIPNLLPLQIKHFFIDNLIHKILHYIFYRHISDIDNYLIN